MIFPTSIDGTGFDEIHTRIQGRGFNLEKAFKECNFYTICLLSAKWATQANEQRKRFHITNYNHMLANHLWFPPQISNFRHSIVTFLFPMIFLKYHPRIKNMARCAHKQHSEIYFFIVIIYDFFEIKAGILIPTGVLNFEW